MSRIVRDEEMRALLALPGERRYEHFLKQLCDSEELWALRDDSGWLLVGDANENVLFPVWPHERYAAAYASAQQMSEAPAAISLDDWIDEWLPRLKEDGTGIAVFPLPTGAGVAVTVEQLSDDLARELDRYS